MRRYFIKWLANSPVQWPSWTWCRTWNHSWHSSRVTSNQRYFAVIRPRTPLVYRYHVISRTRRCFLVAHRASLFDSWATSVLVGLNMTGRAAKIDAKTKFRFGNIVPKQWTLSGFVQHTSANSMYKDDNKISQQQKVLHMNIMLERVTHFQTSFSGVGIQPQPQWRNHRGSTHYPSINCIFSVFSNINGNAKAHRRPQKRTHGAYPYKIKLNLWFEGPQ